MNEPDHAHRTTMFSTAKAPDPAQHLSGCLTLTSCATPWNLNQDPREEVEGPESWYLLSNTGGNSAEDRALSCLFFFTFSSLSICLPSPWFCLFHSLAPYSSPFQTDSSVPIPLQSPQKVLPSLGMCHVTDTCISSPTSTEAPGIGQWNWCQEPFHTGLPWICHRGFYEFKLNFLFGYSKNNIIFIKIQLRGLKTVLHWKLSC